MLIRAFCWKDHSKFLVSCHIEEGSRCAGSYTRVWRWVAGFFTCRNKNHESPVTSWRRVDAPALPSPSFFWGNPRPAKWNQQYFNSEEPQSIVWMMFKLFWAIFNSYYFSTIFLFPSKARVGLGSFSVVTLTVLGGIFGLKGWKNLRHNGRLTVYHCLYYISLVRLIILLCCRWLALPTRTRSHSRISTDEIHLLILPTKLPMWYPLLKYALKFL